MMLGQATNTLNRTGRGLAGQARTASLSRIDGEAHADTLSAHLVEHYGGRADGVWSDATTGDELFARVLAVPGFGKAKGRIFIGLLAKRLDVRPEGWELVAAAWAVDRERRFLRTGPGDP